MKFKKKSATKSYTRVVLTVEQFRGLISHSTVFHIEQGISNIYSDSVFGGGGMGKPHRIT